MSLVHRHYVPGAIVFITQVVHQRIPVFGQPHFVELLRQDLHETKRHHPFSMIGYCFLPEHFHLMIRPTGASNFSDIMHSLKPNFTKHYKACLGISGRMKFWQKGFWDHVIRDEDDFQRHLDYIHYNPVKHGLVQRPEDWPHSSYTSWQAQGYYPKRWGWLPPASIQDYRWDAYEADRD
jgi:putative transposase